MALIRQNHENEEAECNPKRQRGRSTEDFASATRLFNTTRSEKGLARHGSIGLLLRSVQLQKA